MSAPLRTIWLYVAAGFGYVALSAVFRPRQMGNHLWAYIAGNAIRHPYTLSHPLTHLVPWPREDDFGAVCFAASAIAYFLFRLTQTGGPRPAKAADARE